MGMQKTQRQWFPTGKAKNTVADAIDAFAPSRAANFLRPAATPMAATPPASPLEQGEQPEPGPPARYQHSFDRLRVYPDPIADLTAPITFANGSPLPRRDVGGEPVPHRACMERAFGADFAASLAKMHESARASG